MASDKDNQRPPVAIVGVSALFPGSSDSAGFWSDILDGTDRMTDVPPTHWLTEDYYDGDLATRDKTYGRRGGFLDSVELDLLGFGIPPVDLPATDTAQLLALIVAQQVLDDATHGQFSELDRSRVSVILGVTSGQQLLGDMASRMNRPMWLQGMRRAGVAEDVAQAACEQISDLHPEWTESTFPGLLGNVVAGRIANRLDLGGTNCVTDAACASSFSALSMGLNELYLGDSDMVIAGGVDTMNDIFMYMCFSKTPALSQTEDVRPFSDQADGTMLGEGIGMVALKRLADAERDGNHIYCVVNGVGSSSDGRSKSVYAPVSAGQARALTGAYDKAGYLPDTVELVEAHGTGTVAGDAAEFNGLELAFNVEGQQQRQWCALGSVKSQIGHTKAAAGAAGLFKVIMALHHKVLPQTAKIDQPNPKLDLENSPFYLNTKTRPWVRGAGHERRGSVSSFGFGGSNFHVALSEYTGDGVHAPRLRTSDAELVVLCGADAEDLIAQAREHREAATEDAYVRWLAQTSQRSYDSGANARLTLVVTSANNLRDRLSTAIGYLEQDPLTPFSTPTKIHYGIGKPDGEVGFVFPGQGSQYLLMGADLAMQYNEAIKPWDLAADLEWTDETLQSVVFPITSFDEHGSELQQSLLTATQWAQPAIGATSLGMLGVLRSVGVEAAHVGGHSFGEITALHAAGVLSETDMLRVARRRGELMAEAAQSPGAMTAVARSINEVRELVHQSGIDVVVANHNSPTQVVLSGETSAIEQIEASLAEGGINAKRLPVATAFHSPVVSGASGAFTSFLDSITFDSAHTPVHANETAEPYPAEAVAMRDQLGRQLANPVRFVEMIESMYDSGVRTFVEVGPASTLTSLIGKILKGRSHRAIPLDKKNKRGLAAFLEGLGQLAAAGTSMDFAALWAEYGEFENPHEVEQPKLTVGINGANYGAPYPPEDLTEIIPARSTSAPQKSATPAAAASSAPTERTFPVTIPNSESSPVAPVAEPAPAPTTPSGSAPSPAAPPPPGVLAAYQAVQQQTAAAHAEYIQTMAQVHNSFLSTAQQSIAVLGQLAGGNVVVPPPATPAPLPTVAMPPAPIASALDLNGSAPTAHVAAPAPSVPAQPVAPAAPAPAAVVAPEPAATEVADADLKALLLVIVSDKTGYPPEMLTMQMELEADLGIDSIKRVEILSAMQDEVPGLPDVDMAVMSELITLGQIVDYMEDQISASQEAPAADPAVSLLSAAAPTAASAQRPAPSRSALRTVDAPATGMITPGLTNGKIAVTDDGAGVGAALAELLVAGGVDAEVVATVPDTGIAGVIFLGGLRNFTSVDDALAVNREAFSAARLLAANATPTGAFITVSDLGGTFGIDGADSVGVWAAGLTGLARTAAIEWPQCGVQAIDIERGNRDVAAIAGAIADELLRGGLELEVGLSANGTRVALANDLVDVQQGTMSLGNDDVIVVSGGARGVTAATMIELADATAATFVLLGRTAIEPEPEGCEGADDDAALKRVLLDSATAAGKQLTPNELAMQVSRILAGREILDTVAAIEKTGAKARYISVDITNEAAVVEVLAGVRSEFGPITGVVHGAGVLADKLIAEKADDQFDAVFNTKVLGLQSLLTATAGDPLKVLCLFSSIAARTGNNGQADYAMANEILNKVAVAERQRRGTDCVVKSLGWGPWAGGMVTAALGAHFEEMGIDLIPLEDGARMLVAEIASPQTDQVELMLGGGVLPEANISTPQQVAV